jgi:hypothetical protein
LSSEELTELYTTQQLTIKQIAAQIGRAPTTIIRRLNELGIPTRPRGPRPPAQRGESCERVFDWTADLAYAVGLIATDGCLYRDGRHLTITSKDIALLETARRCLGVTAGIVPTHPRRCYRLQWSDARLHRWLSSIGLMPAKSLRLGPLDVPDQWFRDFLRGCIDGDGSISIYTDRYHAAKRCTYIYTRLYVSLVSASPPFVEWLRASVQRLQQLSGAVDVRRTERRHDIWRLRYAKRESLALLRWMYYAEDLACLRRKRYAVAPLLVPRSTPAGPRPGRPMVL